MSGRPVNAIYGEEILPHLHSLTGLRFLAAAMIVGHHIQGVLRGVPDHAFGYGLDLGVSFFFCLSGFVLHYSRDSLMSDGVATFLFRRFVRVWPTHIAMLALVLALFWPVGIWTWISLNKTAQEILSVVFLLQSWEPNENYYFGLNATSWSISTELAFYCVFPLLTRAMSPRPVATIVTVYVLMACYLTIASVWLFDPETPGNALGLGYIKIACLVRCGFPPGRRPRSEMVKAASTKYRWRPADLH